MSKNISIIIIDSSPIICEGLKGILARVGPKCQISFAISLEEIELLIVKRKADLVIINPLFILNNIKFFNTIRCQFSNVKWIGLIYAYYDMKILSLLDGTIAISDSPELVFDTINRLLTIENQREQGLSQDVLSDREIDVLRLLATGMANKEIADKLNISTNTVITHRKNISQKTGIKSVSGLTIYAVVKKLVSIEKLSE